MKNRILALLLAAVMVFALAACTGNTPAADENTAAPATDTPENEKEMK